MHPQAVDAAIGLTGAAVGMLNKQAVLDSRKRVIQLLACWAGDQRLFALTNNEASNHNAQLQ
jgi:hypothetical protein